ncbi:UDP-N-acetylmuramoyl-L-alanyl-D-glutamate--2,6-diaminopimelate ligase [Usitatibacter palustris]|uniref:UDP-N-acetylmuramoyl-L-alanyl-D-glutamate--2,6-diaminopimelate ligase n=1 Tax=Usitatibacter palustris TaxID=2732487 RepID=A0A6M4H423_9PROT|nr:UDP-N-acetylmuramoyl-L-alanyl-D-glutamate--2,6-diaminopimelate ligase [Usitatibacter palustris]QJR13848.1 UDP-N-acetylmuramoyl-L-alanyl-D-glutamate--2,6-diaminopimelate ligase [Usitatibacter palustris]
MICAAEFAPAEEVQILDHLAQLGVPLIDLTADSRAVKMGSVFVAYPGTTRDGRAFITEAIAKGAAAVIWERCGFDWDERWEVPNLGVANLRHRISEIASHVNGDPSAHLWMVGVTGTNGKTSVAQWIARAHDSLGRRAAVLGTLGNGLVGEVSEAKNTTPDAIVLQRLLADYLKRGARVAAMEVSSHGLHQGRVAGTRFDVAVFTNLTRDHLDYHGTMEDYAEAKFQAFALRGLKSAVVNVDDAWGARFAARLAGGPLALVTYGASPNALVRASQVAMSEAGVRFRVDSPWGSATVAAPVLGAFNVDNLLAVLGALLTAGIAFQDAVGAIAKLAPVPGRLERFGGGSRPLVVVDYAHTPDALEKALAALRPAVAAGHKLICVFGCGGDRDPGKRPLMGAAAVRLADRVVVTSDNPRNEDPLQIIEQVLSGIPAGRAEAISERQVAIFDAIHNARAGDVVLLAGKGHETYQEICGVRHAFSDAEVAGAALAEVRT